MLDINRACGISGTIECDFPVRDRSAIEALAWVLRAVSDGVLDRGARVLLNLSCRGQKDLETYFARQDREGAPA